MACPSVTTGDRFLVETLAHLDCQAQTLGSFGFQSLAAPGSPATTALTALLTLFIALYGIRLLFGSGDEPRELVNAVLKVGIVLTLAASWPAWRILAYDTVLRGPAEVASSIMPSTLPDPNADFAERLQRIDSGIAALTFTGTGRQTGQLTGEDASNSFRSIALEDEAGLGWARPLFLASTIGPLAALRIAAGLLLALAPFMAGFLLFDFSRGIFTGWLRGLALTALGSLGLTVLLSIQIAVLEPWLADTLNRRNLGYATPTAPTELLALTIAFGAATAGLLYLLGKVSFHNIWSARLISRPRTSARSVLEQPALLPAGQDTIITAHSRAAALGESVAGQMRREEAGSGVGRVIRVGVQPSPAFLTGPSGPMTSPAAEPLGASWRRNVPRDTASQRRRDEYR